MAAINGKVYLVGAGPGDPKLITLKGIECLQRADVVIYDLLINVKLLEHCPAHIEKIYGGKMIGEQEQRQSEINDLMIRHARAGKTVVRLKGGDPFIFGRGGEEALTLVEAGIDFEVVPGITSAIAAPAYAGIPLTHRSYSSSVAFVTGHSAALQTDSAIRWEQLATGVDTLVVLMGVGHLREIAGRLIQHGRSPETPISLVYWGTTPQQKTLEGTLADIAQKAEGLIFGIRRQSLSVTSMPCANNWVGLIESRSLVGGLSSRALERKPATLRNALNLMVLKLSNSRRLKPSQYSTTLH